MWSRSLNDTTVGSKVIWTTSAWPVVPVQTSSYDGFATRPPEYPDCTCSTPFKSWKAASRHQKHPPARVATSRCDTEPTSVVVPKTTASSRRAGAWRSPRSERPAHEETEREPTEAAARSGAADRADGAETQVDEERRLHAGPRLPSEHGGPFQRGPARRVAAEQARDAAAQVDDDVVVLILGSERPEGVGHLDLRVRAD